MGNGDYHWPDFDDIHDFNELYNRAKTEQWNVGDLMDLLVSDSGKVGAYGMEGGSDYTGLGQSYASIPAVRELDQKTQEKFLLNHGLYNFEMAVDSELNACIVNSIQVESINNSDAKMALTMQQVDEVRHFEALSLYRNFRFRGMPVPTPSPRRVKFWKDRVSNTLEESLVITQIIFEGFFIPVYHRTVSTTSDRFLTKSFSLILRDEARHIATGVIALPFVLSKLKEIERKKLEDFAFEKVCDADDLLSTDLNPNLCWEAGLSFDELVTYIRSKPENFKDKRFVFSKYVLPKLNELVFCRKDFTNSIQMLVLTFHLPYRSELRNCATLLI